MADIELDLSDNIFNAVPKLGNGNFTLFLNEDNSCILQDFDGVEVKTFKNIEAAKEEYFIF